MIRKSELERAKLAKEALDAAELAAEKARSAYHASIGELAAGGASVREIGKALDLSHQRVHQILGTLCCSFCGAPRDEGHRLVSGPRVFICEGCTQRARAAAREQRTEGTPVFQRAGAKAACEFCGCRAGESQSWLKRTRIAAVVTAGGHRICNRCIELSIEILAENA